MSEKVHLIKLTYQINNEESTSLLNITTPAEISAHDVSVAINYMHHHMSLSDDSYLHAGYPLHTLMDTVCKQKSWKWEYTEVDGEVILS